MILRISEEFKALTLSPGTTSPWWQRLGGWRCWQRRRGRPLASGWFSSWYIVIIWWNCWFKILSMIVSSRILFQKRTVKPYEEVELSDCEIWWNQVLLFVQIANSGERKYFVKIGSNRMDWVPWWVGGEVSIEHLQCKWHIKDGCSTMVLKVDWVGIDEWISGWG